MEAPAGPPPGPGVARDLRELLDERLGTGLTLAEAGRPLLDGMPAGEAVAAVGFHD